MTLDLHTAHELSVFRQRGLDPYPLAIMMLGDLTFGNQMIVLRTINSLVSRPDLNIAEVQASLYALADFCLFAATQTQKPNMN